MLLCSTKGVLKKIFFPKRGIDALKNNKNQFSMTHHGGSSLRYINPEDLANGLLSCPEKYLVVDVRDHDYLVRVLFLF